MANIVFDFDHKNLAGFGLTNIGNVDYVDTYSDRGKILTPTSQLVGSTFRPFLDTQGVRFQNHPRSVLQCDSIAHKQAYILFNCLQAGGVYRNGSNPVYTARSKSPNISRVFGQGGQKSINSFNHLNGLLCYSASLKQPITDPDNANPIENFRLLVIDFNAIAEGSFILGGGSSSPSSFMAQNLNGYIKRCVLLDDIATEIEQNQLITDIWSQL